MFRYFLLLESGFVCELAAYHTNTHSSTIVGRTHWTVPLLIILSAIGGGGASLAMEASVIICGPNTTVSQLLVLHK